MTTRSIVTSQPDVACDVCTRRLLRGEQPDVFLAAGRRLTVCELCAPRATHEGWKRETDQPDLTLPPMRPRRGRGLLHRLRGRVPGESVEPESRPHAPERPAPYDMHNDHRENGVRFDGAPAVPVGYLEQAVSVFNASEFPRRVAGVARSLGAPVVSVRSAEHLESIVNIVVAWELSWYRYQVDLGEQPASAQAAGQGTELDELAREEYEGNAIAADSGLLALAQ